MLRCKSIEDPIIFLKEDYTTLQNRLLGALECKFLFHFLEKYDTNIELSYVCPPSPQQGSCHFSLLAMTNNVNVTPILCNVSRKQATQM